MVGISCVKNINSCKRISSISGSCSKCYDGYTISPTLTCVQCPFTGCKPANTSVSASNTCQCTDCLSGYYLSGVNCLACSTANCAVCPGNVCSSCLPNFYFSTPNCLPSTAANCLVAASALTCHTCNNAYYLGSDNTCYSCQTNCLLCTNRFTCTSCADFYQLQAGYCVKYPSHCI